MGFTEYLPLRDAMMDKESPIDIKSEIIQSNVFRKLKKPICDAMMKSILDAGIGVDDSNDMCRAENIAGINRKSFRYFITELCNILGVSVSGDEIQLFVQSRNCLIHRGRFYCDVASSGQRKNCPPRISNFVEFCFIMHFMDRIYLKLFGYTGKYISWENFAHNYNFEKLNI